MNRLNSFFILAFSVLLTPVFALDGIDLAKLIDERSLPRDMQSTMKMVLTNKKGKTRNKEMHSISKDDNKKQIIWFLEPKDDRGFAFLKIEHDDKDDEMRLWMPAFQKLRRISSKNKSDSFMGSDLSYEDLTTRELDDYSYKIIGEEKINNIECYILESTPLAGTDTEYSRHVDWVTKMESLIIKSESYDNKNRLKKTRSTEFQMVKNYQLPLNIEVKNVQSNHRTNLTFSNIVVDQGIEDDQFRENQLKRLPK